MPKRYIIRERGFGSLVTDRPGRLLGRGQLQTAQNVDRALAGVLQPTKAHAALSGVSATNIRGLGAVRLGATNYLLYCDTDVATMEPAVIAYDLETSAATAIQASAPDARHRFLGDGSRAYILNGSANKVWHPDDGAVRPFGPTSFSANHGTLNTTANDVALVSPYAVAGGGYVTLTLTSGADHDMQTGDLIYLSGLAGGTWSTLDGNVYEVTRLTAATVRIDVDGSGLGTCSGGDYRKWPCNLTGNYKWRTTIKVTFAGGDIIESDPVAVNVEDETAGSPATTEYAAVTADTVCAMQIAGLSAVVELLDYYGSFNDITVSGRLWRTKNNGVDFYLVGESAVAPGSGTLTIYDQIADGALGAIWLDNAGDHTAPPADAAFGVIAQQRLFLASGADNKLWFSKIGQYEYFPPLNFVEANDIITGLAVLGESVAISTHRGWQVYSPIDEIGQMRDAQETVGTTYTDSVIPSERGILFCRDDGLFVFDGIRTTRLTEPTDPTWTTGSWRGACVPGRGYFCNDGTTVEYHEIGGELLWSTGSGQYQYISSASDDVSIYAVTMTANPQIVKVRGSATNETMTVKTRSLGTGETVAAWRLILELYGGATATITDNLGHSAAYTIPSASAERQVRKMLPANMVAEWFDVSVVSDDAVLYAVGIEVYG